MFDSVKGKCPHCGEEVELQSKSGKCLLAMYDVRKVPIEIAQDLDKDFCDYNNICKNCEGEFTLVAHGLPRTVTCELVPYTEKIKEQKEWEEEEPDGASYDHLGDDDYYDD